MAIWHTLKFGARAVYLEQVAKASPEHIERLQRRRLRKLVRLARANSEYYREKFAGVDESEFELADLAPSTKSELMENFDRLLTVSSIARHEVEGFFQDDANLGQWFQDEYALSHTSGSQGQPMFIVQPRDNLELLFALQASRGNHEKLNLREVAERLGSPARLAAVTLKPGFYPSAAALKYLPEGALPFIELGQFSSIDEDLVEKLAEFRPTHLTSYASVLHELARRVEQGELELKPDLIQVVNISERMMPKTREHYAEIFGAPVLDDYGMGECLFLTNGCPTSGGMHVNADWAILEVVDDEYQPVPHGQEGSKVLVTNLANRVQPFIRYEIGDRVTMAAEPCGCGSNLPLVARVGGRDSEMFFVHTDAGRRPLHPIIFEHALTHIIDAREYQIIQEENTRFRILVEPLSSAKLDAERAKQVIREHLANHELDVDLQVDVEVVDRLAAEDDNKFKRIISKVAVDANTSVKDDESTVTELAKSA